MRPAKSQRLDLHRTDQVRRQLPHITQSALVEMIKLARETDLSELPTTRRHLRAARDGALQDSPYGPMLLNVPLIATPPLESRDMVITNPLAYLYCAYKNGGGFFRLLNECMATGHGPENPFRLALYADEVVPGNALSINNTRKIWVAYFSFLEFGEKLQDEDAWCPLVCERSVDLKHIVSGISQVFCVIIKSFFGLDAFDMRGGIVLDGPSGERTRLFATLSMVLQDGGAQKLVWGCKGDAGTKLCMLCKNLVTSSSSAVERDTTNLLTDDIIAEENIVSASNADIRDTLRRLAAHKATETKTRFKIREQAYGFSLHDHGILTDPALESIVMPVDQYCHDWMHGIFSSGVFNVITFRCFNSLQGLTANIWDALSNYMSKWVWPRATKFVASKSDLFSRSRIKSYKKAGHIKCAASEGLSILPVMCFFVETVCKRIPGASLVACDALMALGDVVDALRVTPHDLTTPEQLRSRITRMLNCCDLAGWRSHMISKFHWCIHYPHHLQRFGVLPTCWTHERKHKLAKRYANDCQNTHTFSKTVLSEVTASQLYLVSRPEAFDNSVRLLLPKPASKLDKATFIDVFSVPPNPSVLTSSVAMMHTTGSCYVSDVALFRIGGPSKFVAGQVWRFVSVEGVGDHALVDFWRLKANAANASALWHMDKAIRLCKLCDIMTTVVWQEVSAGIARTLIPQEFSGFEPYSE